MSAADQDWDEDSPERLYVITRGRSGLAERTTFDLVTLIVARSEPTPTMQPEHAAILRICGSPLSVAEISAHLRLPMSVVTVLLADLLAEKRIEARARVPKAILPDHALLEAVIHGLQKL
ncbi:MULTISPECIES: DUF742 domain-containing protein [unclassified Kitasatospora]|uniref:DUF742 domain-containing protein n=1 Tax=unclassified Kitasatospora TaxID=2633591 RepID=UPI00070B563B|nr:MULTISPECIES: DUF742 domain-containing protein [unclassified Kitasatospora]KQV14617.1 hypothetical protein ASC99_31190 [Kitasatospora sp. Root107]KRB72430.1 hypothetical protein ASE03_23225 [Kitasatospora sp. Root187]